MLLGRPLMMVMMLCLGPGKLFGSTIGGKVGDKGCRISAKAFSRQPELATKVMVAEGDRNDVTWDAPEMFFTHSTKSWQVVNKSNQKKAGSV